MKKESWFYLVAVASGISVWIVVSALSGRKEAWDSSAYFSFGLPVVCAVAMALAFFAPRRSWRWGVVPVAAQFFWMLMTQGPGNLLPLGIVVFGVLSLPSIIAARIGAFFGNKRATE